MNDLNYADDDIFERNWPTVEMSEHGKWNSIWLFEFATDIDRNVDLDTIALRISSQLTKNVQLVTGCLDESFTISLRSEQNKMFARTTTSSHLIGSENMSAILLLFSLMEEYIGPIDRIQSQSRDYWLG